jgi:hypothetical protein
MYYRPSHCRLGLFIVILLPSDRLGFSYTDVMYTGVNDWGVKATIIDDVNSIVIFHYPTIFHPRSMMVHLDSSFDWLSLSGVIVKFSHFIHLSF